MMIFRKHSGFSVVEVAIAVLSLCLLAVLGYTFYDRLQENTSVDGSSQSAVAEDVPAAPEVNNVGDLDKAIETLSGMNPGTSGDRTQLEDKLDDF